MAPTQVASVTLGYTSSDIIGRHEYGVGKHRKTPSTGGGRAWSEEEEAYLVQTRLRKMPYKHIATHLKKTELACRLHYHQLCHGTGRRRRTSSVSSDISPVLHVQGLQVPREMKSRSLSPPESIAGYGTVAARGDLSLPSIGGADSIARLPTILPKPMSMTTPHAGIQAMAHHISSENTLLPSATFQRSAEQSTTPPLRLDCSDIQRPSTVTHNQDHIDLVRLRIIYAAHSPNFWAAVADDYGCGASPATLEQSWKTGMCCQQRGLGAITPNASPDTNDSYGFHRPQDKTRIASILGVDADPRTAMERDLVKRLEDERMRPLQGMGL